MKQPHIARIFFLTVGLTSLVTGTALASEYEIGTPHSKAGLEIGAVYLQPVVMEPAGMMRPAPESDIHLEADIHALSNNPNGFIKGEWVPHLLVEFELTKLGSTKVISGKLMPMIANDGPHYGDNLKIMGMGKYQLTFKISPPSANKSVHFGRHIDKETGVADWFKPFTVDYEFTFAGTGKKGTY